MPSKAAMEVAREIYKLFSENTLASFDSNGLECLTCVESFDRGQEEHAENCLLSNWQPQPEKED